MLPGGYIYYISNLIVILDVQNLQAAEAPTEAGLYMFVFPFRCFGHTW